MLIIIMETRQHNSHQVLGNFYADNSVLQELVAASRSNSAINAHHRPSMYLSATRD